MNTNQENIINFRDLHEDEIECRVSMQKPGKGISLFIYKTARTDVIILNETLGSMNWQCEYKEIKGNMYCGVSIYDASKNQWVTKWDCGDVSSDVEKTKGEASDAFKRACFKWGIGIELYTAPFIWIPENNFSVTNGKIYDNFIVEKILVENRAIKGLSIKNSTRNTRVFTWYNQASIPSK